MAVSTVCVLHICVYRSTVHHRASARVYIMKAKTIIFTLSISLLLLGGCVASVGTGYDYYPSGPAYYGYGRPYYAPRPVVVRPVYRQPYYRSGRGSYHSDGGRRGGSHGGGNHGGGHSRSRGD